MGISEILLYVASDCHLYSEVLGGHLGCLMFLKVATYIVRRSFKLVGTLEICGQAAKQQLEGIIALASLGKQGKTL